MEEVLDEYQIADKEREYPWITSIHLFIGWKDNKENNEYQVRQMIDVFRPTDEQYQQNDKMNSFQDEV